MLRSFRLKIGLMSVCLSGVLLLGFGMLAVSALNRMGLDRIDQELRALADAQVRRVQPAGHWRVFDDSLRSVHGYDAPKQFLVRAARPNGAVLYESADWPADLSRATPPLPPASEPGLGKDDRPSPPRDEGYRRPPPPRGDPDGEARPPRRLAIQGPSYQTLAANGGKWRVMTVANEDVTLNLAMNLAGLRNETRRFERALLVGIPLGLLLIVAGGWMIGQMALRPMDLIARTAESVTADRLDARIPDTRADVEFRRLIALINGMLDRLERSFRQATRFSADAAHELKTPLAILQAQVEQWLQRAPDGSPEQREYAEHLDEVQRLRTILAKLLLLSKADSGQLPLALARINLADMVRAADDDVRVLAPQRKTTVDAPPELTIAGDADLLNQVFQNLTSNAVKFGDASGSIAMSLAARPGQAVFTITNTGRPIPEQDHDKVFNRFYRADKSRSREIEGSGLGLSLAREIARAHGGELNLERSEENLTSFTLTLPLANTARPSDSA
jgi:signal transduction histidine kinase